MEPNLYEALVEYARRNKYTIEDGTYIFKNGKMENYGQKWAYGYYVAYKIAWETTRPKEHQLYGVWTPYDNQRNFDYVKHVDSLQEAINLGNRFNQKAIWDARSNKEIYL